VLQNRGPRAEHWITRNNHPSYLGGDRCTGY